MERYITSEFDAYNKIPVKDLRKMAKKFNIYNYYHLNKPELITQLIEKQYYNPSMSWIPVIDQTNSLLLKDLYKPYDESHFYTYNSEEVSQLGGYIISGVNLDGLFNSMYVPNSTVKSVVKNSSFYDFSDDEEGDAQSMPMLVTKKVKAGWLIPFNMYQEFLQVTKLMELKNKPF